MVFVWHFTFVSSKMHFFGSCVVSYSYPIRWFLFSYRVALCHNLFHWISFDKMNCFKAVTSIMVSEIWLEYLVEIHLKNVVIRFNDLIAAFSQDLIKLNALFLLLFILLVLHVCSVISIIHHPHLIYLGSFDCSFTVVTFCCFWKF